MSQDFEDEDVHAAKRYKASRPTVSTAPSAAAVDDQSQCRICLERWHNAGPHRVCSLKCGHLFGRSCLERFLDGGNKACPMCRSAAKKTELRDICVSSVVAEDTTQVFA
jgi:E3 ubiquitin-protein ligase RFWD3